MLPGRSLSLFCFPCGWWSFGIGIQFSNELHQRGHSRSSSVFWNFQPVVFKNQEFWKKFDSKILNWKIEKMENNFKKGNLKKFPSIVKLPGMRDRQTLWPAVDHQRDPSDISGYSSTQIPIRNNQIRRCSKRQAFTTYVEKLLWLIGLKIGIHSHVKLR